MYLKIKPRKELRPHRVRWKSAPWLSKQLPGTLGMPKHAVTSVTVAERGEFTYGIKATDYPAMEADFATRG